MARSFNGTSDYLTSEDSTDLPSVVPLTLAAWFRSTSTTVTQNIISLDTVDNTGGFRLLASGNTAGDPITANHRSGSVAANANTTTGYTANTWYHACGVFTGNASRTAYINGGSSATNTTSKSAITIDRVDMGANYNGSAYASQLMSGRIAEAAVWNVALSAAEVSALASGVSPRLIRPSALRFYAPLVGDPIDLRRGIAITNSGTTLADHTRRIG